MAARPRILSLRSPDTNRSDPSVWVTPAQTVPESLRAMLAVAAAATPVTPRQSTAASTISLFMARRYRRSGALERSAPGQRRVVHRREPPERERAQEQPEVAQRDVVEAGVGEQVEDDPRQPAGDHVGAVARLDRHQQPGDDLGHADDVHELLAGARRDVVDPRRQVGGPVDEDVEEL